MEKNTQKPIDSKSDFFGFFFIIIIFTSYKAAKR